MMVETQYSYTPPVTKRAFGTKRQKAQASLVLHRLLFAVALIGMSSLVSTFRYREVDPMFLLEAATLAEVRKAKLRTDANRARSRRALQESADYEVHFLNHTHLSRLDGFSASWLQQKEDFMAMDLEHIGICEDAAFKAFAPNGRKDKMRMTLDWLDFGVEHMSKWWKMLKWDDAVNLIPYQEITQKFTAYINGSAEFPTPEEPLFEETLAVIAFQSFKSEKRPEMAHNLTMTSLAATVESLRRAGFGRVVVAFMEEAEFDVIQDAFLYLQDHVEPEHKVKASAVVSQIGHMEVGWAIAEKKHAKTKQLGINMPKATLLGLYEAFKASQTEDGKRSEATTKDMISWLGDSHNSSYWKYIYLTEPDTILQTKPKALPALKAEVDKGAVIMPHRLQPIPHSSDLPGMSNNKNSFLDGEDFSNVVELDSDGACCDENAGPNFKPGKEPYFKPCGNFWYMCGFGPKQKDNQNSHDRLKPYKLMRLAKGTGIVSLAGSEHARRCIPKKNGVCRPHALMKSTAA